MTRFKQVVFASGVACVAGLAPLHAEFMEVVNIPDGDTLNVRTGPKASAKDIGDLRLGDYVDVKGFSANGKWAQIRYRGQIAWVSARFLASGIQSDGSSVWTGPHQVTGIKAGDPDGGLVARSEPSAKALRLGVLPNGVQVQVVQVSSDGKWAQIPFGTQMAWVSRRYLNSVAGGGTTPQPSPQPMPSPDPQAAPDGLPLPAIFRVTNVAAHDSLNVRSAPKASGRVLAQLQNGVALAVLGMATAKWAKVQVGDVEGYAHMNYLTRGGGTTNAFGFQLGIECIGTEPFWRMTFDIDNMVRLTLMGNTATAAPLVSTAFSPTATGYPYMFNAPPMNGSVNYEICSDGMSDTTYPMSIQMTVPDGGGNSMGVNGCCRLQ